MQTHSPGFVCAFTLNSTSNFIIAVLASCSWKQFVHLICRTHHSFLCSQVKCTCVRIQRVWPGHMIININISKHYKVLICYDVVNRNAIFWSNVQIDHNSKFRMFSMKPQKYSDKKYTAIIVNLQPFQSINIRQIHTIKENFYEFFPPAQTKMYIFFMVLNEINLSLWSTMRALEW